MSRSMVEVLYSSNLVPDRVFDCQLDLLSGFLDRQLDEDHGSDFEADEVDKEVNLSHASQTLGAHSAESVQVMARLSSSVHDKQSFETTLNSMSGHAHNHMSQHVEVVQPEAGQSNLWFQSRKKRISKEKEYDTIQVAGSPVHVV
ncbi:uncharacterized protein A4U43_C08F23520 [Asparagus officinalis]|nr:uncharacterized protein A4U43_C08F23520 [Asparagus officinalis]